MSMTMARQEKRPHLELEDCSSSLPVRRNLLKAERGWFLRQVVQVKRLRRPRWSVSRRAGAGPAQWTSSAPAAVGHRPGRRRNRDTRSEQVSHHLSMLFQVQLP
jgi:hypothetical protein